jgi:hypothetical protein
LPSRLFLRLPLLLDGEAILSCGDDDDKNDSDDSDNDDDSMAVVKYSSNCDDFCRYMNLQIVMRHNDMKASLVAGYCRPIRCTVVIDAVVNLLMVNVGVGAFVLVGTLLTVRLVQYAGL